MSVAPGRLALGAVGLIAGVFGVIAVRDATLSTHQPAAPGSQVDVVVSARTEGAERGQSLPELVQALLLTCRLEVPADLAGPIRDEGGGQFLVTLAPALDKTDRRQLRGCIEDWTIDQLMVDVVSFEDKDRRPRRPGPGSVAVAPARDLHLHPPMSVGRMHAAHGWVLPVAAILVAVLAVGAAGGWLFWDEPITTWMVEARTPALNHFFRRVSFLGSTRVVVVVTLLAAALTWRRCPRLAIAIVVVALARPLAEAGLKELVSRDRPEGDRLVPGRGYSFPSGHPLATAASWGMLPLVAALYTRRRGLWWAVAIGVWTLATLVAVSRVWLGVHWTSDVIAGLALAVLGVALTERLIFPAHGGCADQPHLTREPSGSVAHAVMMSSASASEVATASASVWAGTGSSIATRIVRMPSALAGAMTPRLRS